MPGERFEEHLLHPVGKGAAPEGGFVGAAGGAVCGDLITFTVAVVGDSVQAGFEAEGCGALTAAASAICDHIDGVGVLEAAKVSPRVVADALGGLSPGKFHAAELTADAFHRALGAAVAEGAELARDEGRVVVAMSGDVDSAVAALLAGEGAVGVTVELWRDVEGDPAGSCCSASAVRLARQLAHERGMPHITMDLRDAFRAGVVDPWIAGHEAGVTPNPCVRCNGSVRIDAMADLATRLGARALATGHYARVSSDGLLRAAVDEAKDQSYMLAGLQPDTIARLEFPLGELTKPEVRELARKHDVPVAEADESQDLCFLAGTRRSRFLERHGGLTDTPGKLVDESGAEVGDHDGYFNYTVGQRRGFRVRRAATPGPHYVLRTDAATNTVVVGGRTDLARTTVSLKDLKLHRDSATVDAVKLRYRSQPVRCRLEGSAVELEEAFVGVSAGQTAVLLAGDVVVGSATIAP